MNRARHWLIALCLLGGLGLLGNGLYIPAKALLAQHLLNDAWDRTLEGQSQARPWGWADTWPVARLSQDRLGVDQVVLAGASGRVLAFGPGHVSGSARPGESGNVVLSGHRDTHFAWLAGLKDGDQLQLQLADGRTLQYAVLRTGVHDQGESHLLARGAFDGLRLITCYPFDALVPGGPQRYVVDAVML